MKSSCIFLNNHYDPETYLELVDASFKTPSPVLQTLGYARERLDSLAMGTHVLNIKESPRL